MKITIIPYNFKQLIDKFQNKYSFEELFSLDKTHKVTVENEYIHWDRLQYKEPLPEHLDNHLQWWFELKLSRSAKYKEINFRKTPLDHKFKYISTDDINRLAYKITSIASGNLATDSSLLNKGSKTSFMVKSSIEEAINSSQLEGASTTRKVAKEMITSKEEPKDRSQQMIYNNYRAMNFIKEIKLERLTPKIILRLHEILTEKTLDNPEMAGKPRKNNDYKVIDNITNNILHNPIDHKYLDDVILNICEFANSEIDDVNSKFIHPVLKAIILHFLLSYYHPFEDGNGRTARALFYWYMAKNGYWLINYISISKILKEAPTKYGKAFLYVETDENDLTYFLYHQLSVIDRAIEELNHYINTKNNELKYAEEFLQKNYHLRNFNFRQVDLLRQAMKSPKDLFTIKRYQNEHNVSYETARKDIMELFKIGLFVKTKIKNEFCFLSPPDIRERLEKARKKFL